MAGWFGLDQSGAEVKKGWAHWRGPCMTLKKSFGASPQFSFHFHFLHRHSSSFSGKLSAARVLPDNLQVRGLVAYPPFPNTMALHDENNLRLIPRGGTLSPELLDLRGHMKVNSYIF